MSDTTVVTHDISTGEVAEQVVAVIDHRRAQLGLGEETSPAEVQAAWAAMEAAQAATAEAEAVQRQRVRDAQQSLMAFDVDALEAVLAGSQDEAVVEVLGEVIEALAAVRLLLCQKAGA